MAEVDKQIETIEEVETPKEEVVSVEINDSEDERTEAEKIRDQASAVSDFYSNLAESMDESVLQKLSKQLVDDYKRDRVSRKDWEQSYTKGLDLLGFKYEENTRPFKGSASVTHPLLAEAVTQFQAQAYKELLPSDGPVRTKVLGVESPDKVEQAQRVQEFMNYMLMEQM